MLDRKGMRKSLLAIALTLASVVDAPAAVDVWDNTPGINWDTGANWADGTAPTESDSAAFNLAQTYTVTFAVDPLAIQAMSVSAGSVTFRSSGGPRTLALTSGAGSQDLLLSSATTTLTLGVANNPMHLTVGDDLSLQTSSTLAVLFGSDLVANDLSDNGLNGTLRIDGAGSTLTLPGNVANFVGRSGAGSLTFQNGATGIINASLGVGSSLAAAANGSMSLLSGSTLNLGGNLLLADQNIAGQAGSLTIQGASTALTQTGSAGVTVGSANNGNATVVIGTTASGASFTTGTGLFTINKTGSVTIGNGVNAGTLNVNGNLTINGGQLQQANATSVFDLAAGKTVSLQSGGRLTLASAFTTDADQTFNLTGTNTKFEITGANALSIGNDSDVSLAAGAVLTTGGRINIAAAAGSSTLVVTGANSIATATSQLNIWGGAGGQATVTFSDKAVGNFSGGIDLANDTTAGTTALVNVLSESALNVGNLKLATTGGTTTSATLKIHGTNSRVVQAGAATLTVGHASEGAAVINIGTASDGGSLTTGSGLFLVNKTGTVTVGAGENGGTLEVVGNILVDGGVIAEGSDESSFAWAASKTFTVQNGGRVHFASSYTTANSSQHVISGANSRFEVVESLLLRGAAQIGVSAGAAITAGAYEIGGGGAAGSFIVDGVGTTATGGSSENHWGNGGAATVMFSNQAAATLAGAVRLAETAASTVQVLSGADFTLGDLSIASAGGTANGTLNVVGVGSTVNLSAGSDLALGHATSGTGAINIDDGGSVTVGAGGTTTINGTGTVNIAAGTADLAGLSVVGGTVNVNGGKLVFSSLAVNGGLVKLNSGRIEQTGNLAADESLLTLLLGPLHELGTGRTLAAGGGTAQVTSNFDLNGGRLEGNSLNVANAGLVSTTLRLRNGGTAQFAAGATLAASSNTVVENAGSLIAGGTITQAGELQIMGTGRVAAGGLANSGLISGAGRIDASLANQATGQIRLENNQRITLRGTTHQNNGLVDVNSGEFEVATGTFTNGTTSPATATIAARDAALRFTGGLTNAGSIVCSEGTCDFFGSITNVANQPTTGRIVITANAQATFFDAVTNQGTIQVSAAGIVESTAVFLGSLTGNGVNGTGSVFLEGNVAPGLGIGTMAFGGDASIGSSATVKMSLAGTGANQFDRITVAQSLALSGKLELAIENGFAPAAGQTFDLFDWGTRSGTFATLQLPFLPGLAWNTSQLYATGTLSLTTATTFPGDFNSDGIVDAADYTVWRDGLGTTYTPAHYTEWTTHFGQSSGGAAAIAGIDSAAAPEPSTIGMALVVLLMQSLVRRGR